MSMHGMATPTHGRLNSTGMAERLERCILVFSCFFSSSSSSSSPSIHDDLVPRPGEKVMGEKCADRRNWIFFQNNEKTLSAPIDVVHRHVAPPHHPPSRLRPLRQPDKSREKPAMAISARSGRRARSGQMSTAPAQDGNFSGRLAC